jgi:hypothetical protein
LLKTATAKQNGKPFPQEVELSEKSARPAEVNIALNLDKREIEVITRRLFFIFAE